MTTTVVERATLAAAARRLLQPAERGQVVGTAVVATVSSGGNTSILTGLNYDQGAAVADSTYFQNIGSPYKTGNSGMAFNNGGVAFETWADKFEVWLRSGKWELWINGVQASGSPFTSSGDGLKLVTLPSVAYRVIELRFTKSISNVTGVFVRSPFKIKPVRPSWCGPVVAMLGDSWCDAIGTSNLVNPSDGYAMKLGRMANWDTYAVGYGGEGYTTSPGFIDRVPNLPVDAEVVYCLQGINDNSSTPSALSAAALAAWQAVRARCPNALIFVGAPWRSPGRTPSQALADAVRTTHATFAQTDKRTWYINSYDEGWFSGSGAGFGGNQQQGDLTFTGSLSSATSATLTAAWAGSTGSYTIVFDTGATKTATLTNGSTALSWTGAVTAGTAAYASKATSGPSDIYFVDDLIHPSGSPSLPANDGHMRAAEGLYINTVRILRTLV